MINSQYKHLYQGSEEINNSMSKGTSLYLIIVLFILGNHFDDYFSASLSNHPKYSHPQHTEFSFLLKERVCPLLIKLFSPSLKHRQGMSAPTPPVNPEKPTFPMSLRLLRVVSVVINKYYSLLVSFDVWGDTFWQPPPFSVIYKLGYISPHPDNYPEKSTFPMNLKC